MQLHVRMLPILWLLWHSILITRVVSVCCCISRLCKMAHGASALQVELSSDGLRSLLSEHAHMIITQMASQQANLIHDVNARIDSRIDDRMAAFKAEMIAMKGDMVAEVTASTQAAMSALNSQLSVSISAEVAGLESRFAGMLDNSSSAHSGSQQTAASASFTASSALERDPCSAGDRAAEPRQQQWICPVCGYPLKHEKSFYDHITLLQSRVHLLPGVGSGRRRRQKGKTCAWDVTDLHHLALVAPWARVNLNFWDQATLFGAALIKMLKPGTGVSTQFTGNPRYEGIFAFIANCRTGAFVPRPGF